MAAILIERDHEVGDNPLARRVLVELDIRTRRRSSVPRYQLVHTHLARDVGPAAAFCTAAPICASTASCPFVTVLARGVGVDAAALQHEVRVKLVETGGEGEEVVCVRHAAAHRNPLAARCAMRTHCVALVRHRDPALAMTQLDVQPYVPQNRSLLEASVGGVVRAAPKLPRLLARRLPPSSRASRAGATACACGAARGFTVSQCRQCVAWWWRALTT